MAKLDTESKPVWEPPYIQPHRLGAMNKFGTGTRRERACEEVFGVPVQSLVKNYGSPLFVTSEAKLRANIRNMKRAFQRRYSQTVHGWSYKTNYTSAICNILHQEGSWAEVVSEFEYEKARSLGVPGNRIIFNGPHKGERILRRAIAEGARLHVDNMDELKMIESIGAEVGDVVDVTIRLNFDTGFSEPWTRFGFNLESGQAHEAARYIGRSCNLALKGLHSHIGTFVLEPRAYIQQVRIMCRFMREVECDGVFIETIDIGGGLPSRNALQSSYLPVEQAVPDIQEYADRICGTLLEETDYRRELGKPLPMLIFESGRAVVDDAQVLITSVVGTKRLADGRRSAILNAGVNLLFTAYWYNHQVKLTRETGGPYEETVLYGPLCMNIDVIRSSVQLPPLHVGDHLVITPVGAYNNTQWQQFIEYRPAIVLVHGDAEVSVIREAENLASMCQHDRLPGHLQDPSL